MKAPIDLILNPREQSLMGLPIRRLLPQRQRRHCGPFVFLDHMGPHTLGPDEGLDVPPHPHIGLSTLTWLFDGVLEHRDSLGNVQEIKPGAVNWMTAGRGIVHSERSPPAQRSAAQKLEGLQFWVAQPESTEQAEPRFQHCPAAGLPSGQTSGADWVLVAGSWQQQQSPVRADSTLCLLDFKASQGGQLDLPRPSETWEWGCYLLEGEFEWNRQALSCYQLRISNQPGQLLWQPGARWVVFGGEPLGKRLMDWNFVASNAGLIEAAKQRWRERSFPEVPGDPGYVPYP